MASHDDAPTNGASYEPWVRLALASKPWCDARRQEARARLDKALHLGEVAEAMHCSVFELQAELAIGRGRDVRAYRRIRGMPAMEKRADPAASASARITRQRS